MKCRRLIIAALLLAAKTGFAADDLLVALPVEGGSVDAVYTPERVGPARGAVVLLPERGLQNGVGPALAALQEGLPDHGWAVLTVPLPGDGGDTALLLAATRGHLAAAVGHLQAQGGGPLVLAGHGFGALAAADYVADAGDTVQGLVAIGIVDRPGDERLDAASLLGRSRPPVLDLFGSRDREDVATSAERRAQAVRKAMAAGLPPAPARQAGETARPRYRQIIVEGAGHDFASEPELLLRRVRGWLQRHVATPSTANRETP